ncbi:MAG: hypothetical protein HYX82_04780 [Chloroflexi bacterium]|nr:hypothetical protein [Chloroflexota bacterium]
MSRTAIVFGIGEVGSWALELLSRRQDVDFVAAADIRGDWGAYRTEMAAIGAAMDGQKKSFSFHMVDAQDVDATAKILSQVKPSVIVNAMTLKAPRVVWEMLNSIPENKRQRAAASLSLGIQIPWHGLLAARLLQAIQKSGVEAHVVNISFPDAVNPMLWRHGFGPTCGAGNSEHVAYEIKRMISAQEKVSIHEVLVYFVGAGAALIREGPQKVPPFLRIFVREQEVTSKYDTKSLVEVAVKARFFQLGRRPQLFSNIGASACKNAMAILNDTNELMTVNSPNGLSGDYPVRLSAKGAEIALPKDLSLEDAMIISHEGLRYHGIREIRDDGTVVYTDEAHGAAKEVLGYDCKELHFEELEARAAQLSQAYNRLAQRFS